MVSHSYQVLHTKHHLMYDLSMGRQVKLRKVTDDEARFRCAGGIGILREEIWVNSKDEVAKYNLALILPHLSSVDNGRVLGFDNAHGPHERHCNGAIEPIQFRGYLATLKRFLREADAIRRSYED